jgi:hypothetical protein
MKAFQPAEVFDAVDDGWLIIIYFFLVWKHSDLKSKTNAHFRSNFDRFHENCLRFFNTKKCNNYLGGHQSKIKNTPLTWLKLFQFTPLIAWARELNFWVVLLFKRDELLFKLRSFSTKLETMVMQKEPIF